MARRSTRRAFIVNDAKRKAAYKNRKKCLIKKTMEISTLCGVEACAIIYNGNEAEPEVWPSHSGVQNVLYKFMSMPPLAQSKKMFDQESFLQEKIRKGQEQLQKKMVQNRKEMLSLLMIKCLGTGRVEENIDMQIANDFLSVIDEHLNEIDRKINRNQRQHGTFVATNSG